MTTAVTRRQFLKDSLGAALVLTASGLAPSTAHADEPYTVYYSVTGAEHQVRFDDLSRRGYRIASLSIHGDPDDARYAAVWVKRPGAAFRAVHSVTDEAYQAAFDEATGEGFAPVLIAATGTADNARYAAVFEQDVRRPWMARHGVSARVFSHEMVNARLRGFIPRSIAVYGTPDNPRYAAIWMGNPDGVRWSYRASSTPEQHQKSVQEFTGRGYRIGTLAVSGDNRIDAIWRDDPIASSVTRHNLTEAQMHAEMGRGGFPACLQGGGGGAETRFAAIFVSYADFVAGRV